MIVSFLIKRLYLVDLFIGFIKDMATSSESIDLRALLGAGVSVCLTGPEQRANG